jgi:hypothetical protein
VLTWVSVYWHSTAGPAASLRIYYEAVLAGDVVAANLPAARKVPAGISLFPREVAPTPVSCVPASNRCVHPHADTSTGGSATRLTSSSNGSTRAAATLPRRRCQRSSHRTSATCSRRAGQRTRSSRAQADTPSRQSSSALDIECMWIAWLALMFTCVHTTTKFDVEAPSSHRLFV